MLTARMIKYYKYNRYQSSKYDMIIDVSKKLFEKTIPPTPKAEKFMEYIKVNHNNKIDLIEQFDMDKLRKLEIKQYYCDRKLAICPKIFVPLSFACFYAGLEEGMVIIMCVFFLYYICQIFINCEQDNDINNICKNLANKYNKTE